LEGFGLKVASTEIAMFGERKVLVVERFDRTWRGDRLIRLPQEDCCQALGYPSSRKYQSAGGPSAVAILKLLRESDEPARDQIDFLKSQMVFWLTGATDGHAKNYSIFLRPGGRFELTPFYDVLSVQPAVDAKALPHRKFTLAMSEGDTRHYKILTIHGRHFRQTAKEAGLGDRLVTEAFDQIEAAAKTAAEAALAKMPEGFHEGVHESVASAIQSRVRLLHTVVTED
jgi:serine/threonine-protein kinase HipA